MTDALKRLLEREGTLRRPPAAEASIAALAERFGVSTGPAPLCDFWREADGLALPLLDAHLLGPTEGLELAEGRFGAGCIEQGFLPLLDDHQGGYVGMLLGPPLFGRIALRPGADRLRLLYRGFDGLLDGLLHALELGEPADVYFSQTSGDFPPDAPRTDEDQAAAEVLLASDGRRGEAGHAVRLLAADRLDGWRKLLQAEYAVRREALERLQTFPDPAAQALLAEDRAELEAFADAVTAAVVAAGFQVGRRQGVFAEINGRWTNLEVYFPGRDVPRTLAGVFGWPHEGPS